MKLTSTLVGSGVALALTAALSTAFLPGASAEPPHPPEVLKLTGIVRDFNAFGTLGGHPDFEVEPEHGVGPYAANIAMQLDADGKPVFIGGGGSLLQEWRDLNNSKICHCLEPILGDSPGVISTSVDSSAIRGSESFDMWFRDVLGVNMSRPITLEFARHPFGWYVFDDTTDPVYSRLGGFFPVDGELLGERRSACGHNFHFTIEVHATFTHVETDYQFIQCRAVDDLWVFIDGKMVIDRNGINAGGEQFVDLNRLGLEHGKTYPLAIFYAQRHTPASRLRIETNVALTTTND